MTTTNVDDTTITQQFNLLTLIPCELQREAQSEEVAKVTENAASPVLRDDASSPADPSYLRDKRVGLFSYLRDDGKLKQAEKIFKIIQEKDVEILVILHHYHYQN